MLDEDGVAGQVAVDDGRFTGVQVAGGKRTKGKVNLKNVQFDRF